MGSSGAVSGGGSVPDASTIAKGIVQLAGDLGGTAAVPTVPGKLAKSANLSDLTNAGTARTNLGLGGAAVLNVGTTAGTVADGGVAAGAAQLSSSPSFSGQVAAPSVQVTGTTGAPLAGRFVGVTASGAPASGTYSVGDWALSQNGQFFACTIAGTPGTWVTPRDTRDMVATGEETLDRTAATSAGSAASSGQLRLTFFTARKTETSTQVRVTTGTVTPGTPTLVRVGLYEVDPTTGAGTLVASTANDTTMLIAATTAYTRSWSAGFSKTAGKRYALGILVVTSNVMPSIQAASVGSAQTAIAPRIAGLLSSQSDLPSSFTDAGLSGSGLRMYAEILP